MKKKILFVADSPMEVIISIQVKITLFKDDDAIIIVTDRFFNSQTICCNLSRLHVFEEAIYLKPNEILSHKYMRHLPKIIRYKYYKLSNTIRMKRILGQRYFDYFISSEVDYFSRYLYLAIKHKNKNVIAYIQGEGIFPFTGLVNFIKRFYYDENAEYLRDLKTILFYGPKLGEIDEYETIQIPSVKKTREKLIDICNKIFQYEKHKNIYRNKIIVFEESYVTDGGSDNLYGVIEKLSCMFGKENIIIKRHPRSQKDRFSLLGIQEFEPSNIPWELVALNGDCEKCILISANSASVYLNKIWDFCDKEINCIMLSNIMEYSCKNALYLDEYISRLSEIYDMYDIFCPTTEESFIGHIMKIFKSRDW